MVCLVLLLIVDTADIAIPQRIELGHPTPKKPKNKE
jgi:hypothetical protein